MCAERHPSDKGNAKIDVYIFMGNNMIMSVKVNSHPLTQKSLVTNLILNISTYYFDLFSG